MGPPVNIGNNCTPGPSVIIEDIHNMGPWSAGPSDTGYYVGQVARMIRNLSLKGLKVERHRYCKRYHHRDIYIDAGDGQK